MAGLMLVAATLVQCLVMASAATHIVGGTTGWTNPSSPTFYSDWAAKETFAVGDTLVFNFATGAHDVVEVPKAGYDSCSTSNQIGATITNGPATINLTAAGNRYFFCAVPGHCASGQKLSVTVSAAASPPTTTPPPPPTTTPAPPPTTTTTPPPPPTTTTTPPPPPPPPSATSPSGSVPGAAASLTSSGRVAAFSALLVSIGYYFLL